MVQFLSIIFFFFGFLQFLLGFSKVPVFLCHSVLLTDKEVNLFRATPYNQINKAFQCLYRCHLVGTPQIGLSFGFRGSKRQTNKYFNKQAIRLHSLQLNTHRPTDRPTDHSVAQPPSRRLNADTTIPYSPRTTLQVIRRTLCKTLLCI